ncbi:MAG: amino acid adenylation domain-containing protein [bacterium]
MANRVEWNNQSGTTSGQAQVGQSRAGETEACHTVLRELSVEWNDTRREYRTEKCLHELFEETVKLTPGRIAVCCGEKKLTYLELNERANQLAHFLRRRKVSADVRVGLLVDRSLEMLIGLLGVLKAGGAYVPLNPDHPRARLLIQLEESKAPVLITEQRFLGGAETYQGEKICLDRDQVQLESQPKSNPERTSSPQNLAYLIYTSGSTGTPKGVAVTHQALVNYTEFICDRVRLHEPETGSLSFATVSTISADLGNTCIFPSLVSGGCLHIVSYEVAMDSHLFAAYVSRHHIDVLKIVPSHLDSLLSSKEGRSVLPRKYMIVGGEAFSWGLSERISNLSPDCQVINHYGPTEATVGCLTFTVESDKYDGHSATVPIGRPIANAEAHVLDQHLKPVPVGVQGELYIGGAGLARGYLNNTEQTAERFVPNPFSSDPGSRLYKTGDVVRYLSDRNLEFLGRVDSQVKIHGYRIEPREVEVALLKHPSVRQAFVTALEEKSGEKKLVAYVVRAELSLARQSLSAGEWRNFLKGYLPDYMIPAALVTLDSLPLTANGKIDRRALPLPEKTRFELEEAIAPRNSLELELLDIWERVLAVQPIGIRDDFFDLGGNSLLGLRLFGQIEERLRKRLPVALLFQASTIEELAKTLRQEGWTPSWSSLVVLQPAGSKPPLFCVHACGAHVFIYRPLVRCLPADQPVYGLQAQGLDGGHEPSTRVPEMAAHYVKEIREFQPQGPYYLLGDTLGGLFAFEMARQLQDQGQKVALLAMVDTLCPLPPSFWPRLCCHMVHLRKQGMRKYLSAVAHAVHQRLEIKIWRIVRERDKGIGKYLSPRMRVAGKRVKRNIGRIGRLFFEAPAEMEAVIETSIVDDPVARIERAIAEAVLDEYEPPRKAYPGRITYFLASESLYKLRYEDNRLDWKRLARKGVEVHEISGGHDSLREQPYVVALAERLTACLEKAGESTRDR